MAKSLFVNLLTADKKEDALRQAIQALAEAGSVEPPLFEVSTASFEKIPGTPFAYWANDGLRDTFVRLPPLEGEGRTAKQGLATADDFRFVRAWWEVPAALTVTGPPGMGPEAFRIQTAEGLKWVPFAKGGAYSPYFADLHLVVNWENDGEEIRNFADPKTGKLCSRPQNTEWYFHPGLTWPRRTTSGMSMRPMPTGAIFADKGPAIFIDHPVRWLGLLQSSTFAQLVALQLGAGDVAARSYEVGIIQRTPVPATTNLGVLEETTKKCIALQQLPATADETTHLFTLPAVLQMTGSTLASRTTGWNQYVQELTHRRSQLQQQLDEDAAHLYGFTVHALLEHDEDSPQAITEPVTEADDDGEGPQAFLSDADAASSIISYALGCAFGRWDVRTAQGKPETPDLPDPFAPLPVCSPGMLRGEAGLPATETDRPANYPIHIRWEGIIPEDDGQPAEVIGQIRSVFELFFADPAKIEHEAVQALGTGTLRSWVTDRFFAAHIRKYSKSRRKAPVYWQLRSAKKSYGLWLYYPRLTKDTLYVALRDYVEPKLGHETDSLKTLQAQLAEAKLAGGRGERALAKRVAAQEELVQEIAAFRDEIKAVADAGYDPDRNDGVLINIAPLHKLVPWRDAAACYKELKAGKYPWSTMAKRYNFR